MRRRLKAAVSGWLVLAWIVACVEPTTDSSPVDREAHAQAVEQWRQERHERLEQPDGWFSLVGLTWLEEGENTCGSDSASDIRFPESLPERLGVFSMSADGVEFIALDGVDVEIDGEVKRQSQIATDAEGEPTILEIGTVRWHLIDRGGRIGVRIKDSQSAALLAYDGIESYPIDADWRIEAKFLPYDPPKPIAVPSVLGGSNEVASPGAVELRLAGGVQRLDVMPGSDGEYFVVFGDATNGDETYGGGRFLYAAEADAQGRAVLDFNRAYNPPCAFTAYATCPLPPRQNRLAVAVRAGEKTYAGLYDH